MGNSLRCCLSCVLPCGALDLIRIVHLNGQVDEFTRPVTAADVLKDYPNHVLTIPSSQGVVRRIIIISHTSHLKRGHIYFLIPSTSIPHQTKLQKRSSKVLKAPPVAVNTSTGDHVSSSSDVMVVSSSSSMKKRGHRRARRTVHAGDWTPILESIFEEQ